METAQMMPVPQALRDALAAAVPQLQGHCLDAWVVIGSAAAALAGAQVEVADLDLLTSQRDAERLITLWHAKLDAAYQPAAGGRFRSRFARFRFPGLPVEVMGGLELRAAQGWMPVRVHAIEHVACAGVEVPVPSRAEQICILESFARPKDLQRAHLLRTP